MKNLGILLGFEEPAKHMVVISRHTGKGRNKTPHKFTRVLKTKRIAKKLRNKRN